LLKKKKAAAGFLISLSNGAVVSGCTLKIGFFIQGDFLNTKQPSEPRDTKARLLNSEPAFQQINVSQANGTFA
jgi:hypothetical protein